MIKEYRKLIKNWWNDHTKMKKIIQKNKTEPPSDGTESMKGKIRQLKDQIRYSC